MSKKFYCVDPLSQPSSGLISFANGSTSLVFPISENNNEFYVGGSARITFKFRIKKGAATIEDELDVSVSPQSGLGALFTSVDVHSYSSNTQISSLKNHGRAMSSVYSVGCADTYDVANGLQMMGLSQGLDFNGSNVGVYNLTNNPNELQSYSVRLLSGALEQDWYLGSPLSNGVGGLKISLQICSDATLLTRLQAGAFTYELSDVKLVYQTKVGTPDEIKGGRMRSNWVERYVSDVRSNEGRQPNANEIEENWQRTINSTETPQSHTWREYTNYLTTIQSNNAVASLNLQLAKVHSIFANFIQSSYLNNLTTTLADSNKTYPILDNNGDSVPFSQVTFTKGSKLFPYLYTLSSNVQLNNYNTDDDYTADRLAEMKHTYLDSIVPYVDNKYQQASSKNSLFATQYRPNVKEDESGGKGNGIGSGQLSVTDGSSDFRFQPLGLQLDTKLNGTFVNTSAFIYALHETKLEWQPNGLIQVSS
tara:strand:- start:1288 stop:2724 length:1437 start_codon:yes stop_codon:yes gene_type:complete